MPPAHDLTESQTKKGKQLVVCDMILTYECNFGTQIARTSNLVQCATMQFPYFVPFQLDMLKLLLGLDIECE
jgi:hypothetical protein